METESKKVRESKGKERGSERKEGGRRESTRKQGEARESEGK